MELVDRLTPVFQMTSNITIDLMNKFYGVDCDIYYPSNNINSQIVHGDPDYRDTPDDQIRLVIPDLYNTRRSPLGGINDNLFQDTYTAYVKHTTLLPRQTKIVFISKTLGIMAFSVDDSDSVSTLNGVVYTELTLSPYLTRATTNPIENEISNNLAQQYTDATNKIDSSITDTTVITSSDASIMKYKFRGME